MMQKLESRAVGLNPTKIEYVDRVNVRNHHTKYNEQQLRWSSSRSVSLGSCKFGFNSESGQTNDFKIGIHSFPA